MFYTKTNIDTMFAERATHNNNLIVTLQDYYDKDEIDNIVSNVSNDANNVNNGISESDFGNLLAPRSSTPPQMARSTHLCRS